MSEKHSTVALPELPTNHRFKNLTGEKFGRLTVLRFDGVRNKRTFWLCRCECGTVKSIIGANLPNGTTASCGCWNLQAFRERTTKHGMCRSPEYEAWCGMIRRCEKSNRPEYRNYGGRGLAVCKRWRNSFEAFYADMGPRPNPSLSLERVDNDKGYNPSNCIWAPRSAQNRNQRRTRRILFAGRDYCAVDFAKICGVCDMTVIKALRTGLSPEQVFARYAKPREERA